MELVNAFKKGDWLTRSSAIVMGFGNILRKQFIKGILFLFTEAAFLFFMAAYGWQCLLALPGLGEKNREKCGMKHWASMNMFREITPC